MRKPHILYYGGNWQVLNAPNGLPQCSAEFFRQVIPYAKHMWEEWQKRKAAYEASIRQ